ncbi:MAG: TonB-dependent receptor plug domain-containing protein, partial [Pseudomonadota bacterium]|nr:TonB-dependent receptor plug domain-containing protein [Pseudomonadota bacterium]
MKRLTLSAAIVAAIYSAPSLADNQLNDVFVTAGHHTQTLHSVTANATVITANDIEDNHYRTLSDALNSVNGFNIVRNGGLGNATSALVRGQSTKNLLILVDGVEMNNPSGTGGAILSNLLLSNVARIEILKGPQSGIWGANASSGVVNIITNKSVQGTQGSITVEKGSFNQQKLAGQFSSSNEQGDFSASFSRIETDGFSAVKPFEENHDDYEKDAFNQTDFGLNIGININANHRVETTLSASNGYTEYDYGSNPDQTDFASVNYKNTLKKLQYVYNKERYSNTLFVSQNEIQQYSDAVINSYGVKGGLEYSQGQNLNFIASANQYQNETTREDFDNLGFGLSNTNQFNQGRLIITESIRSDQFNEFDDKITGKLGVKNFFNENVFASANIGTAYNTPTLFQLTYGATSDLQ